jgi:hypothetical protein
MRVRLHDISWTCRNPFQSSLISASPARSANDQDSFLQLGTRCWELTVFKYSSRRFICHAAGLFFPFLPFGPEFLFAHGVRMHQVALLYEIIIVTNKGTLGTADIDSFLSVLTPRPACRVLFHQKKDVSKYSNGRNDRNHLKGVCHALVTP